MCGTLQSVAPGALPCASNNSVRKVRYLPVFAALTLLSAPVFGQTLIVTAEGSHGAPPPAITKDELKVEVAGHPAAIETWTPLKGAESPLELYVVIDDGVDTDLALQYPALKSFISSQPASTRVGLAYLRNGAAFTASNVNASNESTMKALRIPLGEPGISSSPYMGISDLLKKWPAAQARREILLLTSGIDPWSPTDPQNPYLLKAISDAQKAGVLVHSIYYGGAGHLGHSYWRSTWGQNFLSELGDETGGEAYWQGTASPVAFEPYLKDLTQRFQNQYLLTVSPAEPKHGLESVKINYSGKGSVVATSKVELKK